MAKRGGLGRGLDALIPDKKPLRADKPLKESKSSKKGSTSKNTAKKSSNKGSKDDKDAKPVAEEPLLERQSQEPAEEIKRSEMQASAVSKMSVKDRVKETLPEPLDDDDKEEFGSLFEEFSEDDTAEKKAALLKQEPTSKKQTEKEPEVKESVTEIPAEEKSTENKPEEVSYEESADKKPSDKDQLSDALDNPRENAVINMRISDVEPNRDQPRKYFDDDAIMELADSIRQFGIIQPLLVQERDGYYEIIAGERRWRAARKAGLKEVPVIIKRFSNQEAVEVALVENIQREDLNPIEEAKAYERLVKEYGLSQEAVAGRVSKSRTAVTNSMRLLRLDKDVQKMVETSQITEGHARAILGIPAPDIQKEMAETIVKERLSVRQTEKLVRDTMRPRDGNRKAGSSKEDIMLKGLSENLKTALGTKVNIRSTGKNKGRIEIDYYSEEELDRIYEMLLSLQ